MAKDVGAKKVIVASCAPPIRFVLIPYPDYLPLTHTPRHVNVYGIDMPSRIELVAHDRNEEEIAAHIGADHVIFQKLPDLIRSVSQFNPALTTFDCSVFTGEYVTGGVDDVYLHSLEQLRADNVKRRMEVGGLGTMEGKGGGAVRHDGVSGLNGVGGVDGLGGVRESREMAVGCSGPMNGADSTVGLHNTHSLR